MISGLILLLFGLATLAFAVITTINIAGTEWFGMPTVTILGWLALYGGLEVVGAIGIFGRHEWGRVLGRLTSTLGVLAVLAILAWQGINALSIDDSAPWKPAPPPQGMEVTIILLAITAVYGFVLWSLARGEHAFRRSGPEQQAR